MVKVCSKLSVGVKGAAIFAAAGGTRGATVFGVGAPVARPDPIRAPTGPKPRSGAAAIGASLALASGGDDASDRPHDPDIAGAAAEVAAEAQPDAPLVGLTKAKNQIASGDQHSRRAESALQRVLAVEGGAQLDRDLVVIEALDRRDVGAAAGAGEGDARADRLAVDEQGAGPANPMLATQMRACEVERLAQEVGEMPTRLDFRRDRAAVDAERKLHRRRRRRVHAASGTFAAPCTLACTIARRSTVTWT